MKVTSDTASQDAVRRFNDVRGQMPDGVALENGRKSGNNEVRLWISQAPVQRLNWVLVSLLVCIIGFMLIEKWNFGGSLFLAFGTIAFLGGAFAPEPRLRLSLSGQFLTFSEKRRWWWLTAKKSQQRIPYGSIESVTIQPATQSRPATIEIKSQSGSRRFGAGLNDSSLAWLKDYIIMELAGLTWRPLSKATVGANGFEAIANGNPLLVKPELALRLISLFLDQSAAALNQASVALARSDLATVARQAHWLKTSSASVGAHHLSELCQLLEARALEGNASLAQVFLQEAERTLPGVEAWLSDLKLNAIERLVSGDNRSQNTSKSKGLDIRQPTAALLDIRVLVADDSEISQELAYDVLSGMVRDVIIAGSGAQAIAMWREQSFDIILMDCEMEDINGLEATRQIRCEEHETGRSRTPIVALTGHTLSSVRDECLAAGMDAYLTKPYRREAIQSALMVWAVKGNGKYPRSLSVLSA